MNEVPESWYKERVSQHDKDLYFGDGRKAGLVTRVELTEEMLASVINNLSKIVWLLVGILLTGAADVIARAVHP